MDIDILKLRQGEDILCPACGKGLIKPIEGYKPDQTNLFLCSHCSQRVYLVIDTKRLNSGEEVLCTQCGKGVLLPEFGASPDKAIYFQCNCCGSRLHLYKKMTSF